MAATAVALLLLVGGALWPKHGQPGWSANPLTCAVFRSDFLHEIAVKGTVESTENVEVWCDVSISGFYATRILELVPEGPYVQPGDFLVRFDLAPLEEMKTRQQIYCCNGQALVTQSEKIYEMAVLSRQQYMEGTYRQQKLKLDAALAVAQYQQRRRREYCEQSRKLYAQGYITQRELEADEFAANKAQVDLDLATTRVNALEKYTRVKMEKELECNVLTSRARLDAARVQQERNLERLSEIETQIGHCLVTAPSAGQVEYAHLHHYGHSHMIEEGATVYCNQVVIRLPDPRQMQVKVKIREENVARVEVGMPARVELQAYPGVELPGHVKRIAEYPEPLSHFGSSIKEFEAIITLDDNSLDLRTGLTADAKICAKHLRDQLLVPTQAVVEHLGKEYCITCDAGHWQATQVETGSSDGKYVVIRNGLDEGRHVILSTEAYRDKVGLAKADQKS
jgi:HlyD family secretion protein